MVKPTAITIPISDMIQKTVAGLLSVNLSMERSVYHIAEYGYTTKAYTSLSTFKYAV